MAHEYKRLKFKLGVITLPELVTTPYLPKAEINKVFNKKRFVPNLDYKLRDEILKIDFDWETEPHNVIHFNHIDVVKIEILFLNRYLNPASAQNESPFAREFFEFMCQYPQTLAHGYAVSPLRKDYRITLEGIYVPEEKVNENLKRDFLKFCQKADELAMEGSLYAWWD